MVNNTNTQKQQEQQIKPAVSKQTGDIVGRTKKSISMVGKIADEMPGVKQGHELLREFLGFLSSKSVLPIAVGLIMADIVKQLVTVLVDGIIRPFLALFLISNNNFGSFNVSIKGQVFRFGDLISTLVQGFIVFAVIYILFAKILKKEDVLEGKK